LLLLGLGSAACVSLAKPDPVEEACPTPNAATCVNQATEKRDAGQATHDVAKHDAATKPARDAQADSDADEKEPPVSDAAFTLPEISDEQAAEPPGAPESSPEPPAEPEAELPPEPSPDRIPISAPEPGSDAGVDTDGAATICANAKLMNGNGIASISTNAFDTVGTYCFVTCDNILYWGCSSFNSSDGSAGQNRTVVVNGVATKCGGKLPPKTSGGYYYFELGPGGHTWDSIWWLGPPSASCPTAGFAP
jgi:hypothetical protein